MVLVFGRLRRAPVLGVLLWALVAAPCQGLIATTSGAGSGSRPPLPDSGVPATVDASTAFDAPVQAMDAGTSVLDAPVATIDAQPAASCGPIDQSSIVIGQYPLLVSGGPDVYLGMGPGIWYLPSDSPTAQPVASNGYMIAADATYVYYIAGGARTLTAASVHGLPTKTFPAAGSNVLSGASIGTTLFVTTDDPDAGGSVYTVLGVDVATGLTTTVGTVDGLNNIFAADLGHVYLDNGVNSVARMALDGSLSPVVPTNLFSAALELDGAWIYAANNALERAPADLSMGFAPFTGASGVGAIDGDATDLYFTAVAVDDASVSGAIERVPLDDSSPPTVIASGAASTIAVSDECVVWATSQGVYRSPKH